MRIYEPEYTKNKDHTRHSMTLNEILTKIKDRNRVADITKIYIVTVVLSTLILYQK